MIESARALLLLIPLGRELQAQADSTIVVTPSFAAGQYVTVRAPIELQLSRFPAPSEGSVAVILGTADLTALFDRHGDRLVYRATVAPLPSGETEVAVYLVSDSHWRELGRFPLPVLTPAGFTSATATPSLSASSTGQLAQGSQEDPPPGDASSFDAVSITAGMRTSHERSGWTLETQENVVGTTVRRQALRFGERGAEAPLLDLSDYQVTLRRGAARLSVGNTSLGNNRHLINSFGSRGATLTVGTPTTTLSLGMLGGSAIVGWNDLLGFVRRTHRVSAAAVAIELRPTQPGVLHFDVTLMNGSLQPRSGFTQNALTDAERSTGAGFQLAAATPSGRLRVAGGVSLSRFVNLSDSLLSGGGTSGVAAPARKTARYLEATAGLLQNVKLAGGMTGNLTAGWRYERVDPLYRSVASFTRPDILSHTWDLTGNIGALAIQAAHGRSHDNLGNIASILRSLTRSTTAQAMLSLAAVFQGRMPSSAWPTLGYQFSRSHQLGASTPGNSSFTPADVPDQVATVHGASAEWQGAQWRASYRYNHSLQDNRQPGREGSDLAATTHTAAFGLTPLRVLAVGLDLSTERQHNREFDELAIVHRAALNTNWRPREGTSIVVDLSASRAQDGSGTRRSDHTEVRLEVSQSLILLRSSPKARGQIFLRFARQATNIAQFSDPDPLSPSLKQAPWTLASGLTLQLF